LNPPERLKLSNESIPVDTGHVEAKGMFEHKSSGDRTRMSIGCLILEQNIEVIKLTNICENEVRGRGLAEEIEMLVEV
jgi:hypothetical protein